MDRSAVVEAIVQLVAKDDHHLIERVLVQTLCELIPDISVLLLQVEPAPGRECALQVVSWAGSEDPLPVPEFGLSGLCGDAVPKDGPCRLVRDGLPPPFTRAIVVPLDYDGGARVVLIGGRVPDASEDQMAVGVATIFHNYVSALAASQVDGLTRLFNRRAFDEKLAEIIGYGKKGAAMPAGAERRQEGNSHWLAICDIDLFKTVNDTFGHVFGDEVLLIFAQIMRRTFRHTDMLFRYGGEEFAVVLNRIDEAGATAVLERFRVAISATFFPQVGHVTCTIGFTRIGEGEVPVALFGRADQALYYGKTHGRNQLRNFERLVAAGKLARGAEAGPVEIFAL